jgi:hypothetical protein
MVGSPRRCATPDLVELGERPHLATSRAGARSTGSPSSSSWLAKRFTPRHPMAERSVPAVARGEKDSREQARHDAADDVPGARALRATPRMGRASGPRKVRKMLEAASSTTEREHAASSSPTVEDAAGACSDGGTRVPPTVLSSCVCLLPARARRPRNLAPPSSASRFIRARHREAHPSRALHSRPRAGCRGPAAQKTAAGARVGETPARASAPEIGKKKDFNACPCSRIG